MAALLNVIHDSQNEFYRFPVGAAATESKVRLRLKVETDKDTEVSGIKIRIWEDRVGETLYSMARMEDGEYYEGYVNMPKKGTLLWLQQQ